MNLLDNAKFPQSIRALGLAMSIVMGSADETLASPIDQALSRVAAQLDHD